MNSAPTEVLVATAYMTMTMDGGIKIPNAPEVVITPAPNFRETRFHHRRQQNRPNRHHGCRARTRYRRKQCASQYARQAQAAVPMPHHRRGKDNHAFRHPAMREEVTRQDKERNRHDLELLNPGEQL